MECDSNSRPFPVQARKKLTAKDAKSVKEMREGFNHETHEMNERKSVSYQTSPCFPTSSFRRFRVFRG
jgi:hypothetical protein